MMRLLKCLRAGDILAADTAYSAWGLLALLLEQGTHAVMPLHQARRLKAGLHLIEKPQIPRKHWTKEQWDALPKFIEIRVLADTWQRPGFRKTTRLLVTTLLDSKKYPDSEIIALYCRRWDVELGFRNLKDTMGLGILRTKTADRVAKEIAVNVLAYNLLRHVMWEGSRRSHVAPRELSFCATLELIQLQGHGLKLKPNGKGLIGYEEILRTVSKQQLPKRRNPYRWEPRVKKRRPSNYPLMTKPRKSYKVAS
jgi:hypothetical protein